MGPDCTRTSSNSDINQIIIPVIFQFHGYASRFLCNGKEALQIDASVRCARYANKVTADFTGVLQNLPTETFWHRILVQDQQIAIASVISRLFTANGRSY